MTGSETADGGKVGIYVEPSGGLGGSQYMAAVLAAGLSEHRQVELVHHQGAITRDQLETFAGLDLQRVSLRVVAREPLPNAASSLPWRLWQQNSRWHENLSRPYETFINVTHGVPPFCRAPHGILVVLFPFFQRNWMRNDPPQGLDPRRRIRDAYYDFEWRRRMRTYSTITSISEFTRKWTREYWEVDSKVIYPPVDTTGAAGPKDNVVLSIGRFSTTGHPKKQDEIIRAFNDLGALQQSGWRHHSIGGLSELPADRDYFAGLEAMAGPATSLFTNVTRAEIKQQLSQAKLFVHAAGFGEPEDKPEATEHFGIATVEAMAAGAVPIVVNRGAQPEIVNHGVSGFVWNTPEELKHYIVELATDENKREQMARAARERAELFSRRNFLSRMQALLPVR